MNTLIFVLLFITSFPSVELSTAHQSDPAVESFKWLTGTWKNVEQGTYESWRFLSERSIMKGKGFRITAKSDTVVTERLQIICEGDVCHYIADIPQNPVPTWFRIVSQGSRSFRSENYEHGFPKFVEYWLWKDGKLEARIGDDSRTIFVRKGELRIRLIQPTVKSGISKNLIPSIKSSSLRE